MYLGPNGHNIITIGSRRECKNPIRGLARDNFPENSLNMVFMVNLIAQTNQAECSFNYKERLKILLEHNESCAINKLISGWHQI